MNNCFQAIVLLVTIIYTIWSYVDMPNFLIHSTRLHGLLISDKSKHEKLVFI